MQDYFDANFGKKETINDYKWGGELQPTPGIQIHRVLDGLDQLYKDILVVHLLKYKFKKKDNGEVQETKLDKLAKNPFRLVINKEQLLKEESKATAYELIGFILHSGSTGGGHYEAYAKKGEQWVWYNDSRVSIPSDQDLNGAAEKAYVYFYKPVN
jgi:ubiquitin C-terminal hydrolase